jgi:hypothetical protein
MSGAELSLSRDSMKGGERQGLDVPVGQMPQEWKAPSFSGSLEAL